MKKIIILWRIELICSNKIPLEFYKERHLKKNGNYFADFVEFIIFAVILCRELTLRRLSRRHTQNPTLKIT